MDDAVLVQVLQALEHLARNGRNLSLAHDVGRDNVGQAAALHVLHTDPEIAADEERVDVIDNVGVPRLFHDEDLVDDEVLLRLLLEVHLLDRD